MGIVHAVADEALEFLDAIDLLISEAKIVEEQRTEPRVHFLRPVKLSIMVPAPQQVSALSRDLSPFGIGLLHTMPLEPQEVVVHMPLGHGGKLHLRAKIEWCDELGEDYFLSGGRFLGVASRSKYDAEAEEQPLAIEDSCEVQ
jgi:hypothetical protein